MSNVTIQGKKRSDRTKVSEIYTDENNKALVETDQLAHERNIGTANQYGVGVDESNGSVVDVSTNSTDVSSSQPALLFGVYVNTAIATEAVGLHDGAGGTELITLPIGLAAGTKIEFKGIKFNTALFVESGLATGSITLEWRPQ